MHMVGHDAPGKYLKPFILLAVRQVVNQYVFVFVAGKYVCPAFCG